MKILEIKNTDTASLASLNILVSAAFGYKAPHTFFDDFPIWNSDLSEVVRLGIFENEKLVSHVGIRYCEMKTSGGLQKVALIGAVATDENFRSQGMSTALMTEALKRIDEKKCLWSMLWGSEHAFYGKFGFKLEGHQGRAPVAKFSLPNTVTLSPDVKSGMSDLIFNLLINEPRGIKITEKDRSWIFKHKTIQWLWLEKPFAFVGYQRGMDLHHMIHELGGDSNSIQTLFYRVYAHDPLVEVMSETTVLEKLGFEPNALIREHLCLARPLHAQQKWNDEYWVAGISAC